MYGMNYSGGDNKTHGQIEHADRINSFESGEREDCGLLMASRDGRNLPLIYDRYTLYGQEPREIVELFYPGSRWHSTLELTSVPSSFGGRRFFWLCPTCGKRARYLYFKGRGFVCRDCAKLNYRSQQRTKNSINHFRDGMRLATDKLQWRPLIDVVQMDFPYVTPDRPRYMHQATYRRYLARYRRYQEKYQQESWREMLAILRR